MKFGLVRAQPTVLVEMPRADFRATVRRTGAGLSDEAFAIVHDASATIDRFAFSTFLHAERGCGCLIGEHLVASKVFDRHTAAARSKEGQLNVIAELRELHGGDIAHELHQFGFDIDGALRTQLLDHDLDTEDPEEWFPNVRGVYLASSDVVLRFVDPTPPETQNTEVPW